MAARKERIRIERIAFAAVEQPLYVDNIGHLGPRGIELLADAIAGAIRSDLAEAAR